MGGNEDQVTLPNLLMKYTSSLQGYSLGVRDGFDFVECSDNSSWIPHEIFDELNAALSGACAIHLLQEVDYLIERAAILAEEGYIDLKTDWKLLTILIGANDLCEICLNHSNSSPQDFANLLDLTLQKLHDNFPRTFVNLLPMMDLTAVYEFSKPGDLCYWVRVDLMDECTCLQSNSSRALMQTVTREYNQVMRSVAQNWQQKNLTDFAVIIQPILEKTILKREYVSELDCFHPNALANQIMAVALWNSMLTPSAKKKNYLDEDDIPIVPTPDTFLFTT